MEITKNKISIKKKIFIIIAIVALVSIIAGISYALWSVTKTQTDNNLVNVGCFDVDYEEVTDAITLSSALPITDAEGKETSPYTFELTNTCNILATYQVNVEVLPVDNGETKLADEYVKIDINNSTSILSTNEEVEPTITGASKSYTIKSGVLSNSESQTFNYRQWLDYDTTTVEGANKQFKTKITIVAIATTEPAFLASEPLASPGSTSVFWGGTITRDTVETIEFTTTSAVPAGVIGSWDVSEDQDGKVMAWYTDTDNNNMYEVVVGANGGVYAPTNSVHLFRDFRNLNNLDLTNLNTSKATNMARMFYYTGYNSTVFTLDLGDKFDTSNVINMNSMFVATGRNSTIFTLDLGDKFDTSKVANMSSMFHYAGYNSAEFTLYLGDKFDTSNVTDMASMFLGTGRISTEFTLDLGNKFDTSNVTNMSGMFSATGYGSPVFTLDLGDKFDTSSVTDMSGMFSSTGYGNSNFTLDLGNKFDTSNVTNMSGMFRYTGYSNPNFILDLRNFNVSAVTTTDVDTFKTGKTTHKLYASASNVSFMSGKGFTGTIINCTTSPASCPQ